MAPLLLGTAAAGYLASIGGVAAKGGVVLLLDRARDFVSANGPATAVAGVAAAVVIATTTVITFHGNAPQATSADNQPGLSAPGSASDGTRPSPAPRDKAPRVAAGGSTPLDVPAEPGSTVPPTDAATTPSDTGSSPGDSSTDSPGGSPTDSPTDSPSGSPTDSPSGSPSGSPSESGSPSPSESTSPSPSGTPTDSGSPSPTDSGSPSSTPTDPTSTPPAPSTDVALTAVADQRGGGAYTATATVSGLNQGNGVTLDVAVSAVMFAGDLGPRCSQLADDHITCHLDVAPTDTIDFVVVPQPGTTGTVTFTILPDEGTPNDDTTNDTVTLELEGPGGGGRDDRPDRLARSLTRVAHWFALPQVVAPWL